MQREDMQRMLLLFCPPLEHETYIHEAEDGTLRAWDVTAGNALARDGRPVLPFSLVRFEVSIERIRRHYEGLDEAYALTTDLSHPLLFIPLGEEILLIDGSHRLAKAALLGIAELPMYLLSDKEAARIQWLCLPPGHGLDWR